MVSGGVVLDYNILKGGFINMHEGEQLLETRHNISLNLIHRTPLW